MGLFSLDIERFYHQIKDGGGNLKGIFCIQYPIYCIHANIKDVTPDALDNIDRLIADLYTKKPNFTSFQVGSLIGTSKTLVEFRVMAMAREGLMIIDGKSCTLTQEGLEVFKNKTLERQHSRSYDFYLDGVSLKPLTRIFYTSYRSKLISETDIQYYTTPSGETRTKRPFGPDIVHTPPDKPLIIKQIFDVEQADREDYFIPPGLTNIEDTSFTKQTFYLMVAVSSYNEKMVKEIIDGFAIHSLSGGIPYYETLKKHVKIFEGSLLERIKNLEFKITIPRQRDDAEIQTKPLITSNWGEIDRYQFSADKCFSFSSEDLLKVIEEIFNIKDVPQENVVNGETSIEISLTKKMLLNSSNRQKMLEDLIRERDYKFVGIDKNVFLLYLYFKTEDTFVKQVLEIKEKVKSAKRNFDYNWLKEGPIDFQTQRELLVAAGEFEILEEFDIQKHMNLLN